MELIELNITLITVSFGLGTIMAFFVGLIGRMVARKRGSAYYGIKHD